MIFYLAILLGRNQFILLLGLTGLFTMVYIGATRTAKPTSFSGLRDWQLTSNRRPNRLHPSTLAGMGSPCFTTSPSSTSSSPPPAYSGTTYDPNSGLPPTPPQSAPPQKTFGFRFRSKSMIYIIHLILLYSHQFKLT